jgi:ATP-binding cassette subfamily C (CFTR/MRP) protein 4
MTFSYHLVLSKKLVICRLEIREIQANLYVRSVNIAFTMFLVRTSIFLCVLTYVLTGNKLQAQFVYVVTSFYGTLRQPLTLHLPRCIAMLAEINISLKRVEAFLLNEETKPDGCSQNVGTNVGIAMRNACVKWMSSSSDYTLNDLNFDVGPQQLVAVVGRVGSGKTTLLHVILKEIQLLKGELDVKGTISYASQEPWIFSSSIRQNILFGQKMDVKKYNKVVQVCALEKDFVLFPYGDRTIVGERGVMLSGGQKARVSLARAIYKDADIYLLDDPLSAVDTHVGKQLFEDCISGYLKNKCTVLVTHQIQYLSNVDKIFVLKNGSVVAGGSYAELKSSGEDFVKLLNTVENDEEVAVDKTDQASANGNRRSTGILKESDLPVPVKEQRSVGTVSKKIYLEYFRFGGSYVSASLMLLAFILTQVGASGVDYFLTVWVNLEQEALEKSDNSSTTVELQTSFETNTDNLLSVYSLIIIFLIVVASVRSVSFVRFCMKASKYLHNSMFAEIVRAPMRFFNTNPSGRILNRFSRDVGIVDETLPTSLMDTIQVTLATIKYNICTCNKFFVKGCSKCNCDYDPFVACQSVDHNSDYRYLWDILRLQNRVSLYQ